MQRPLLGEKLLDELAVALGIPVRCARNLLAYYSITSDDHCLRKAGRLVSALDPSRRIVQHLERHAHVMREGADARFWLPASSTLTATTLRPLRSIRLVQSLDAWYLHATRLHTRSPR